MGYDMTGKLLTQGSARPVVPYKEASSMWPACDTKMVSQRRAARKQRTQSASAELFGECANGPAGLLCVLPRSCEGCPGLGAQDILLGTVNRGPAQAYACPYLMVVRAWYPRDVDS